MLDINKMLKESLRHSSEMVIGVGGFVYKVEEAGELFNLECHKEAPTSITNRNAKSSKIYEHKNIDWNHVLNSIEKHINKP